jgi:hypothetical protein
VVAELSSVLKTYRVTRVVGDRYGGVFPVELFRKNGISFRPCDRTKSQLFLELLPRLNSGTLELLDHERSLRQICALERRTSFSGLDAVGHAQNPSAKDDLANAIAGAAWLASAELRRGKAMIGFMEGPGCGRVTWRAISEEEPRARDGIRVVYVDEHDQELTAAQAQDRRRNSLRASMSPNRGT